jgi:serine/threonine protein kinase
VKDRTRPRPPVVERLERVEAICSRFEQEWSRETPPPLAAWLDEAEQGDRPVLLRELLLVEWSCRERLGKPPDVEGYRSRFGELTAVVEDAWNAWGSLSNATKTAVPLARSTVAPEGKPTTPPPPTRAGCLSPALLGYTDVAELGAGGMGVVYRARDKRLGRFVALKMIRTEALSPERRQRFRTEAKALAALQHPHIVQVYGWEELPDRSPVLAMEYVPGATLEQRLKGRRLSPRDSARLVAILARAVQAAHAAGIVHRDLKPANVLMAAPLPGNAGTVLDGFPKVADFGLARVQAGDDGMTHSGAVLGTPAYMSPEQARGEREVGPPADVWALGVILYRCLSGSLPFAGDSVLETLERVRAAPVPPLAERAVSVSADLEAICARCLEKEPARRPSAADLAEVLERFLAGDPMVGAASGLNETVTLPRERDGGGLFPLLGFLFGSLMVGVVVFSLTGLLPKHDRSLQPSSDEGIAKENEAPGGSSRQEKAELKVRLRVTQVCIAEQDGEKVEVERPGEGGAIGVDSFRARFGDGVRLEADLSAPAYAYLLAFNANGSEQLLLPENDRQRPDDRVGPLRRRHLTFPTRGGKLLYLDDEERGGLQVFAVVASRRPLPPFAAWKKRQGDLGWRKQKPGLRVWVADLKGVYPRSKGVPLKRGTVEDWPGAPPLTRLAQALRVGGVEQVEMLAFPVQAKEAGR